MKRNFSVLTRGACRDCRWSDCRLLSQEDMTVSWLWRRPTGVQHCTSCPLYTTVHHCTRKVCHRNWLFCPSSCRQSVGEHHQQWYHQPTVTKWHFLWSWKTFISLCLFFLFFVTISDSNNYELCSWRQRYLFNKSFFTSDDYVKPKVHVWQVLFVIKWVHISMCIYWLLISKLNLNFLTRRVTETHLHWKLRCWKVLRRIVTFHLLLEICLCWVVKYFQPSL